MHGMKNRWMRSLTVLALGGAALSTFGIDGCWTATNGDYETMFTDVGAAVIQTVSDTYFSDIGTDYEAIVRPPTTAFAQSVWANWVDQAVADDPTLR